MAIRIDEELYRTLFRDAIDLVKTMAPAIAQDALSREQDLAKTIGDTVDGVFRRVLEGYEKQEAFTKEPAKRPASMRPKPRVPFA